MCCVGIQGWGSLHYITDCIVWACRVGENDNPMCDVLVYTVLGKFTVLMSKSDSNYSDMI